MKKRVLAPVCAVLLAAAAFLLIGRGALEWYHDGRSFTGTITEVYSNETDGVTAVVLRQGDGKEIALLLSNLTWVRGPYLQENGHTEAEIRAANLVIGAKGDAHCSRRGSRMTAADGRTLKAYPADHISVYSIPTEETLTLSDGTVLQLWAGDVFLPAKDYCLEDGTVLLSEQYEEQLFGDYILREPLPPQVWEHIENTMAAPGKRYDVTDYLEQALAEYRTARGSFSHYQLSQENWCQAESESVIYCATRLIIPLGESYVDDRTVCRAFDRATGEELPISALFTKPEASVREALRLRFAPGYDEAVQERLFAALRMEDLSFSAHGIDAMIPQERLPGESGGYLLSWSYEALADLIQPWAVPFPEKTAGNG